MPEDWMDWPVAEGVPTRGIDAHVHAAQQIARRLAGDSRGRGLMLTREGELGAPELDLAFDRFEILNLSRESLDVPDASVDVLVAIDAFAPGKLPDGIVRARKLLVEGGVLLMTAPARARDERPFPLNGIPDRAWHELELQYRLRRAGYQGLRIRRIDGDDDGQQLLAMAVRRAHN
jgi:hypothetical protein